jgi:hypothetical protein
MNAIELNARKLMTVHWSLHGSCGNSGCADPECACGLCRKPIGISEDDPRWNSHDPYCSGCELCEDRVPLMLFRGEGSGTQQAQFHTACFELLIVNRSADNKEN